MRFFSVLSLSYGWKIGDFFFPELVLTLCKLDLTMNQSEYTCELLDNCWCKPLIANLSWIQSRIVQGAKPSIEQVAQISGAATTQGLLASA
jgi:hypothetical protein